MHRLLLLLATTLAAPAIAAPPSVAEFAARPAFDVDVAKLSPDGTYLALTVPLGDRGGLVTLRMADLSRVGAVQIGRNIHIADFDWIGPDRIVYSIGQKFGDLKRPVATGELFAMDVDGGNNQAIIGFRAGDTRNQQATRLKKRESEAISAWLIEPVDDDPTDVFVATAKWGSSDNQYTQVERLDVRNGRRRKVASVPVTRADFTLDHAQQVRFARGSTIENDSKLFYRANDDAEWILINDQATSHRWLEPIGFSADNATAYLIGDAASGPDAVFAMDPATRTMREVVRDSVSDPYEVLYSPFDESPIGVMVAPGKPKALYFDPESPAAALHRSLQNSFPDQTVRLRRMAADGTSTLFTVVGERNSGEIYAFDLKTRQARFLAAADANIDPATLGQVKPIAFDARDGLRVHGYLTLPPGSDGKNLPMVVLPHGGPHMIFDQWGYDAEVQLLATRGYAVLQANFRGSGGYGNAFEVAGYKQWGRTMQDDITDAVRWAIAEGIADKARICIHGSSYGAYTALMGAAREPDLYRCVSGNVGVYDLRAMTRVSDTAQLKLGRNYFNEVLAMDRLDADSPVNLADRIKVPVMLSAGAEDERTPPEQTERMAAALQKAGVPVESKIYRGEGHGYFVPENRIDYYERLLAFLDKHIGRK